MASPFITPLMGLTEPAVGNTLSPTWAQDLSGNFSILDGHTHQPGSGVQITPAGLNINTDLSFQSNNAINLRTSRYVPLSLGSLTGSDIGAIVIDSAGDLYYVNTAGLQIQITNSSGIVGNAGSISGLVSPASATYVAATDTFVWQSGSGIAANMDAATYILRYPSTGYPTPTGNYIALEAPSSLSTGYALIFPNSLPTGQSLLQLSSAGNITASNSISANITLTGTTTLVGTTMLDGPVDITGNTAISGTLNVSGLAEFGGTIIAGSSVYPGGSGGAFFESPSVDAINVISNDGTSSYPIVTSAQPSSSGALRIIRGIVSNVGAVNAGEGFSSSGSAGTYNITFSQAFGDIPAITANAVDSTNTNLSIVFTSITTTGASYKIWNPSDILQAAFVCFTAIGRRSD